ncbi:MAG TPA: response regulator [Candidatus Dormibacteraeota bacterium]|nr:response regulator [Candidatus Dormibacteraeota bacterium]
MCGVVAMPDIENRAGAQMRMTPSEKSSSEIVCLVDDDPLVLRSIGLLLASDGFTVRQFDKGEDFIAYVVSHDVPLVVLDIWMEEMTGLEALAQLCSISPQTHVVVITGREDSAARITAMQIGTVALLIKPFDDEEFLEVVHLALGHAPESSSRKPMTRLPRPSRTRGCIPPEPGCFLVRPCNLDFQ